jgi:Fe-S-cluster containining protein
MFSNQLNSEDIFNCTQCGECCKGFGGTFVSETDIQNIANYFHISYKEVLSKYCQESGGKPLLAVGANGYCVFWNKICTIHPIKPRMCRAWPYIESVLKDITNWQAMGSCCPGINQHASEEKICKIVQRHLDNMG